MLRNQLISDYHLDQNKILHNAKRSYGGSSYKWAEAVRKILYSYDIETILDYGCGEATLEKAVFRNWRERSYQKTRHGMVWSNYDPAIKARSKIIEKKYDLVVCTDVLEHIEPNKLDNVLEHIFSLAGTYVFFVIALNEANKSYPDGSNTHLIIELPSWWMNKIIPKTSWQIKRIRSKRADKDLVLEISP